MIVVTTSTIEGRSVARYLGIVVGTHVAETQMRKSFGGGIRGVSMSVPHTYAEDLRDGIAAAQRDLIAKAETLGADAVLGADIDYQLVGDGSHLVFVSISGTAVSLAPAAQT